jgi:ribosomal protein L11 methyltransferase
VDPTDGGHDIVRIYLEISHAHDADVLKEILESLGARDVVVTRVAATDWMAGYRQKVRPFAVGRSWWIDPHPEAPTTAPRGRHRLAVEPSSAFGSGSHESTQLILTWLEEESIRGAKVLDVGTGSAILALAALCVGARLAVGFDIDPSAVWVAMDTVTAAGRGPHPCLFVGPIGAVGNHHFDVALCNMIAREFIPLLADIRRVLVPGGRAVFSGILGADSGPVRSSIERSGFTVTGERIMGEWSCTRTVRNGR